MLAIEFDDGGPRYLGEDERGRAVYYVPDIQDAVLFKHSEDLLAFLQQEIEDGFCFRDMNHRIVEVKLRPEITRTL